MLVRLSATKSLPKNGKNKKKKYKKFFLSTHILELFQICVQVQTSQPFYFFFPSYLQNNVIKKKNEFILISLSDMLMVKKLKSESDFNQEFNE